VGEYVKRQFPVLRQTSMGNTEEIILKDYGEELISGCLKNLIPNSRRHNLDHASKPQRLLMFPVTADETDPATILKVPVHAGTAVGTGDCMSVLFQFIACSSSHRKFSTVL
jgi:hypothetical protein